MTTENLITVDVTALQASLRNVTRQVLDAARGTAAQIETAQTEVDTGASLLVKTLEDIDAAEFAEHVRHNEAISKLANRRNDAIKEYRAVVADVSGRMRALNQMLVIGETRQIDHAGETNDTGQSGGEE